MLCQSRAFESAHVATVQTLEYSQRGLSPTKPEPKANVQNGEGEHYYRLTSAAFGLQSDSPGCPSSQLIQTKTPRTSSSSHKHDASSSSVISNLASLHSQPRAHRGTSQRVHRFRATLLSRRGRRLACDEATAPGLGRPHDSSTTTSTSFIYALAVLVRCWHCRAAGRR